MSLAAIFPSFTTTETHDTAMIDDAQLPPAGDMDMSPRRDPMQSFTATPSMEWGAPSQPQLPLGDQSMIAEGAFDTSMYGESGPVDMEMTGEYDMTMDDDVTQHQNYEMHMADATPIAPASLEPAVPLVAGHVYAAGVAEVNYPVPTPVHTVDPGLAAPVVAPLHTNPTEVAQLPLYSPQDTFNTVVAPISELYAPVVAPTGPETEVASGPAPPAADSAHDEPVAAVAELSAPPESETAVERDAQSADQVVVPVQDQPADADADADASNADANEDAGAGAGEHYHTSHTIQEPEPETAHVTEVVSQSEGYRQVEQEAEAPPAESAKPQEETREPYAAEPPTLGIPPILLSIPFSPASSPTHSAPSLVVKPLYSLFSKPDFSTLPSSSSQPHPPDVHLLLANRPQMFFENIATFLHALREELLELEGGGFRKDMFEFMEMILHARQLDLTLPEDNIHAQSISLYDFAVLHQSCAVPGYLHLDLLLQTRFKSRWDEIKRAVSEQEREYEAEAYVEHDQAGPGDEGHEVLAEQAPLTTVHEEQAEDGTAAHAEYQPELRELAPTPDIPHQAQQQQQTTNDQPSFDLADFVGFEEPPLDDDDDNWDDDDDDTAKVVNQTSDTFTSFANTEVPAQNNEGEGQEGQEQYTNSHQFSEGEGVTAEYDEYNEGEWVAEEKHETEGVPTEAAAPPAGQEEQARTIEAGDEVAQYDGEEYIGPEYEYVYDESEDVEGGVGEWTGDEEPLNTAIDPGPGAAVDNSQDASTQQDDTQVQTTQESAATATTVSLHHLPVQTLGQQQGHEQPEGETQELEEYYDTEDGDTREYFGKYDERDEDGDGSPEYPINLTDVHGRDDQPAEIRQVHGDPDTYTGEQDVDEISTLEGSPSQDDQPALPETEVGDELVNDEGAADDPVFVDARAKVPAQRRPSGQKRRHEDVEVEENEENFRSEVKRARLS